MRVWIAASIAALACGGMSALTASPALSQAGGQGGIQASFDCRRASSDVERVICGDARLAAADRAVASAYTAALRRFDLRAQAALQQDQRWFNAGRAYTLPGNTIDRVAVRENMLTYMNERARTLSRMTPPPGAGLVGRWQTAAGEVVIRTAGNGRVSVSISAAAPGNGRWLCETSGQGVISGTGMAQQVSYADSGWRISVRREGQLLRVTETGSGTPPYCGANGFVQGLYFPVPL